MKKFIIAICLFSFLFTSTAFAHQPRLVGEGVTQIENPEVSQAFYGELKGEEDNYQIVSDVPFNLYVGLLLPDLPDVDKNLFVEIYREDEHGHEDEEADHEDTPDFYYLLNGVSFDWTPYYEEFGGDNYLQGPELGVAVEGQDLPKGVAVAPGIYNIRVFSLINEGRYVLVVGEKEEFPLGEIWRTIKTLPTLKKDFFEKPAYTAYFNLVGLFMLIFILMVAGVLVAIILVARRLIKKKK